MNELSQHPDVVTLQMSKAEAWSVLRGLAIAFDSERTEKEDRPRMSWAAARLLKILDERVQKELAEGGTK